MVTFNRDIPTRPVPPESRFEVSGISPWAFDFRRKEGPWSERNNADVYGKGPPPWLRKFLRFFRLG